MTNVVIGTGSGMGVAVALRLAPGPADRGRPFTRSGAGARSRVRGHVVPAACDMTDQDHVDQQVARIDELDAQFLTAGIWARWVPAERSSRST